MRVFLFVICVAILAVQLFLPGFIGIANNSDFGKVAGWLSLAAVDGGDSNFLYFQPNYTRSPANYWASPYYSSERVLAWMAARFIRNSHFDIRVLGAVHAAIFLAALAVLLRVRPMVAAFAVFVFTDVCYAAYCNSFYMDAAALCGLLLLVATASWIAVSHKVSIFQLALYGLAGLLFVTSKAPHALWTWLPVIYILAIARRRGIAVAVLLLAGGIFELATADRTNRAQALFDQLFFQIRTADDLRALGVRPDELQYAGMHAYMPGSPAANRQWVDAFYDRTGYGRLLLWYLRHPARTAAILQERLTTDTAAMRPENLSNFREQDHEQPGARTSRFGWWSNLRSGLLARWPYHVAVWYLLFFGGAIEMIRRRRGAVAWLALGVAVLGAGEFLVACLADSMETGRHLFLFHVCTEMTFCFAIAAVGRGRTAKPIAIATGA